MRGSRIFARVGGGGVQAWLSENNNSDNVFFSPQLILQFYRGFRGGPTFSRGGGGATFPRGGGGVKMQISIETHITCDFPGGGGFQTPYPPLWIRTWLFMEMWSFETIQCHCLNSNVQHQKSHHVTNDVKVNFLIGQYLKMLPMVR